MLIKLLCSLALCIPLSAFSQKVYSVKYESQADVKVYVVDNESQCDLKVYKVNYSSQADKNKGRWYFVDYESQAGWKNKSKQHLMY